QNCEPVRDRFQLLQTVRYVDDGQASAFQVADQPEQLLDFVDRKRRGGLVHYDHTLGLEGRARNFDELAVGRAQPGNADLGVKVEPVTGQQPRGAVVHLASVDDLERGRPERLSAQKNVFCDSQMRSERQLLIDHRYSVRERVVRTAKPDRTPLEQNLARVGM